MPRVVVVLLSGGLDSTVLATMAHEARELAAAVFVDYGQPAAAQERLAASRWCGQNRAPFVGLTATIQGVGALAIGTGKEGARVVPCRNLLLVSLAASVAAEREASEIWYGATAGDQADYSDCRPTFAAALSSVLSLDCGVTVHLPLSGMRRSDVRTLARALSIRAEECWSCYEPTTEGQACGSCNSCRQDAGPFSPDAETTR